ncbi:hypothetical protein MSj_03658 [Microcystis aeruginosa Sj]|uniref:Uncharacterized protein n=1 Tax=Microcystis aeruginosa Sj TaxID=1979544 RepID=A0A2Z6UW77_MICAE|nr:hypothetical protein [Microcystis aeruginosa]GBL12146.1 hypothetical protein MSj_03658 [Microcystis aeruginosa Sj]
MGQSIFAVFVGVIIISGKMGFGEFIKGNIFGSSLLGMIRYGGINRLNPYLVRDLID